ncbi:MAG: winged helix-turn-helix domain-containing protein [Methanobacteriota archaeon]
MSKIDEYIRLFPEEIRDAIKSLSEDSRIAIMIDLNMEPQGKTFSELMTDLEISQGLLDSHLKNLLENGLVKNEYRKVAGRRDYSFYLPTILGSTFMVRLLEVLEKPVVHPVPTKAITYRVSSDIAIGTKAPEVKPKNIDRIVTQIKQAPAPLPYRMLIQKTKPKRNLYEEEINKKFSNPYLNHEEYEVEKLKSKDSQI